MPYTDTDYATLAEFKERVNVTTSDHDDMLQQIVNSAAYVVDQITRKPPFGKVAFSDATAETRYFDDRRNGVIIIDDLISATTVEREGEEQTANTDYFLEPYNEEPKTRLVFFRRGDFADPRHNLEAVRGVAITGTWGFCTEANRPPVIKEATLVQAEKMYERMGSGVDVLGQVMADPWRAADALVKVMLRPLMRVGII